MTPAGSFFRYTLGFLTFISLSFAITFAVSMYEMNKSAEEQAAAAVQALFTGEEEKESMDPQWFSWLTFFE